MSLTNIRSGIENVNNQVEYLENYQVKIYRALDELNCFSKKWGGLVESEEVYFQIDRWLKCYDQLSEQLKSRDFNDKEITELKRKLLAVQFTRPSTTKEDALKGFKSFSYKVFPFYRIHYNKKKIKSVQEQMQSFSIQLKSLKTLSFKIEAFVMDSI